MKQPPPSAAPLIAAITGMETDTSSRRIGMKPCPWPLAASERSRPAQKALSPAAVRIATLAAGSASKRFHAARTPSRIAVFTTLRFSGRFRVTIATGPCIS